MSLLFWILKPVWYAIALTLASRRLQQHGPHWRLPDRVVIGLATVARYGAGWGVFLLASTVYEHFAAPDPQTGMGRSLPAAIIIGCGFVLWLVVTRVAFRRAPLLKVVLFALAAELMSGVIDYLALREVANIHMC
jgi:hypothetical protein